LNNPWSYWVIFYFLPVISSGQGANSVNYQERPQKQAYLSNIYYFTPKGISEASYPALRLKVLI
jgi:hypothetical protein